MIGTFSLVFAGCGAIMVDTLADGVVTHVGIGLTFGLVIMAMIYATGHISGAHFNPAVTIAFASVGRFPWSQVPFYVMGQIAAAILASEALSIVLGPVANLGMTTPAGAPLQSLVLEGIITFVLMFVIIAVATDSRAVGAMAGWAIGGAVAVGSIFAGPVSGASMNPARSLGPALASGDIQSVWIYILGPLVGAIVGALAYCAVRCETDERTAAGCC